MRKYLLTLLAAFVLLSCSKKEDEPIVDKIRASLSTSQATYDAVAANNWVNITSAEYNNLLTVVTGAARKGAIEGNMTTASGNGWDANYTIGGNPNFLIIPASSYIIAWSVRTSPVATTSSLGSKLKVSASQTSGYTDYGNALPDIGNISTDTRVYFVLKTPTAVTPASESFIAVYNAVDAFLGSSLSGNEYYNTGDNDSPSIAVSSSAKSQVISTSTKQW